jgi:hypothetical protein
MGAKFGLVVLGLITIIGTAVFLAAQIKRRFGGSADEDDFYDFDEFDADTDEEFEHFFAEDNLDPLDDLNSFNDDDDEYYDAGDDEYYEDDREMTQNIESSDVGDSADPASNLHNDTDEQAEINEVILDEELLAASIADLADLAADINSVSSKSSHQTKNDRNDEESKKYRDEKTSPDFSVFDKLSF